MGHELKLYLKYTVTTYLSFSVPKIEAKYSAIFASAFLMESRRTVISTSGRLPPPTGGRVRDQLPGVIVNAATKLV